MSLQYYSATECSTAICGSLPNKFAGLTRTINDEGVWRIRRQPKSDAIELFKIEEVGHGRILTDEFINWRIKLGLKASDGE